jgi:hypothetical protein
MPKLQLAQEPAPGAELKVPALQSLHAPEPAKEYFPPTAGETCVPQVRQAAADVAPVVPLYLPALHRMHAPSPVASAYLPFPQMVHEAAPGSENVPAAQLAQSVGSPAARLA